MSTPNAAFASPEPGTPPALSEPERIINTFIAPTKTFEDIRRNASWWAPFLLLVIVSYITVFAMQSRIGMEQMVENAMTKNPKAAARLEQMSPDQRDQAIQMQVKISKVFMYIVPVVTLIAALIIAGILLGTFNFGLGAQIKFANAMAIVMYSFLVTIISSAFMILMMFLVQPDSFDPNNPVMSNPAYLMDSAAHPFLYRIASAFDIFVIWMIFLMAIGFSTHSKVKRGTAFFTIFGWFIFWKLITGGFALAFS